MDECAVIALGWARCGKAELKKNEFSSFQKKKTLNAEGKKGVWKTEHGASERVAELKSEDRRLKKIRGGYIYIYI